MSKRTAAILASLLVACMAPQASGVSVKDSPGYYSIPDPESASVKLGRRTNAPVVHKPFQGGATNMNDLGRAICRALHRSASDSLMALCVTQDEFKDILWREFPQSRPATGLTWEDGWTFLYARLRSGGLHAIRDYGGHPYQFLRFEPVDSTGAYKNFKLLSGLTMVVKDDQGQVQKWRWLRAVAERKGRYKIYSTED